jgi:hypothetical protein
VDVIYWIRYSPGTASTKLKNLLKTVAVVMSPPPESDEAAKKRFKKDGKDEDEGGGGPKPTPKVAKVGRETKKEKARKSDKGKALMTAVAGKAHCNLQDAGMISASKCANLYDLVQQALVKAVPTSLSVRHYLH